MRVIWITVVQSLHTPFELQEPLLGEQQGGWKETDTYIEKFNTIILKY